jgi:agmatinase
MSDYTYQRNGFTPPYNYCGLPDEFSDFRTAGVLILPIPYEATTTYGSGTKEGPGAIIRASRNMELYDDELDSEVYTVGIHTLPELETVASGPKDMIDRIYRVVSNLVSTGKFIVSLGGEHSITSGIVKGFKEAYPGLSVLQFDAHADLRDSYQGTPYSHASVMRRVVEMVRIVQVGIRSMSSDEADYIKASGIASYSAYRIARKGMKMEEVLDRLSSEVYVTLDLDVLDPSVMPSTGTPEPGGLGWYQLLDMIREVASKKRIVGLDVVELAPQPGNPAPDFLAAKLIYKILGYRRKFQSR